MYVCLSSGHRPRYLRDVARALALPPGMWLYFRYERGWIADEVRDKLDKERTRRTLHGERVLIAYIDQHPSRSAFEIVPCRFATLVNVSAVGQTASLRLQLEEFAHAADLARFNDELGDKAHNLPHRAGGEINGAYWLNIDSGPLPARVLTVS
ncbi:MAG TPA: hypothetical protein VFM96_14340, partial [Gaiellaceae bacterium]|nr:hypothetical protein [Gaiellaceae bacterium]